MNSPIRQIAPRTEQEGQARELQTKWRALVGHVFLARQELVHALNLAGKNWAYESETRSLMSKIEDLDVKVRRDYSQLMRPKIIAKQKPSLLEEVDGTGQGQTVIETVMDRQTLLNTDPALGNAIYGYEMSLELLTDANKMRAHADSQIQAARDNLFETRARVLDLCSERGIIVSRVEDLFYQKEEELQA